MSKDACGLSEALSCKAMRTLTKRAGQKGSISVGQNVATIHVIASQLNESEAGKGMLLIQLKPLHTSPAVLPCPVSRLLQCDHEAAGWQDVLLASLHGHQRQQPT